MFKLHLNHKTAEDAAQEGNKPKVQAKPLTPNQNELLAQFLCSSSICSSSRASY